MILVTGPTGKVGGALCRILSEQGVPYAALVRTPAKADALRKLGAHIVEGSFDDRASLDAALKGITKTFHIPIPGPNHVSQGIAFIEAARAAGVKHIVKLSNFAPTIGSPNPVADRHAQINIVLNRSGIPCTHLFGNFFMQNMAMFAAPVKAGRLAMPCGLAKVSLIDLRDVAAVGAAALTRPGFEGRTLEVAGAAITFKDVADALAAATGHPVEYEALEKDNFQKFMVGFGLAPEAATNMANLYSTFVSGANAKETSAVQEATGRPPLTFAHYAHDNAGLFR